MSTEPLVQRTRKESFPEKTRIDRAENKFHRKGAYAEDKFARRLETRREKKGTGKMEFIQSLGVGKEGGKGSIKEFNKC